MVIRQSRQLNAIFAIRGIEEACPRSATPEFRPKKLLSVLSSPVTLFANDAAPGCQAFGRMLCHPLGELRSADHAGLHRNVSKVRTRDGLLVAISRRGETAEHGDDLDHESTIPSLRCGARAASSCEALSARRW